MITLGQKVEFNPLEGVTLWGNLCRDRVEGTVIFIHEKNNWFMAEYTNNAGDRLKIGFNFCDIGKTVKLID